MRKEQRLPRKLKKELKKVECLQTSQPLIKMSSNLSSPNKMISTQYQTVKFKEKIWKNKWTKRLERNIIREFKRSQSNVLKDIVRKESNWFNQYTADYLRSKLKTKEISIIINK